jgi:hypothetical protein
MIATPRMLLLVVPISSVLACGKDKSGNRTSSSEGPATTTSSAVAAEDKARAAALIGELKKSLLGAVTQAMGQGIPAAIATCHTEAPALTVAVSREGAVVGRMTRKPRNPGNAVTGWQADALSQFEKLVAEGLPVAGQSFARRLPDGRVAYAEPLVMAEVCLICHGSQLGDDVRAALAERYPDDQATGYALGELRGLAWAELPAR